MKSKIVFKNSTIITQNKDNEIIKKGLLSVENGIITYVGQECGHDTGKDSFVIDMRGKIIIPGFINSHTHCQATPLRGSIEGYKLDEYLRVNEKIRDRQSSAQREHSAHISAQFGLLDSIYNGNTAICSSSIAKYAKGYGVRLFTGPLIMKIPRLKNTYRKMKEAVATIMSNVNYREVFPVIFIHSLYRIDIKILNEVRALMERYPQLLMTIHIAETSGEVELIKKEYGKTPVGLLHSFGLLTSKVLLVHCCYLSNKDVGLIVESDARVAICPLSNIKLGGDIPDIPLLIKERVKFCIASDGIATNNTSNLPLNARITYFLAKQKYGYEIPSHKLLSLITKDAAVVLGCPKIGSLTKGCMADFVAIDSRGMDMQPRDRIIENIIFSSNNDITDVVIGGQYYLKNKRLQLSGANDIVREFNGLSGYYGELIGQYNKKDTERT